MVIAPSFCVLNKNGGPEGPPFKYQNYELRKLVYLNCVFLNCVYLNQADQTASFAAIHSAATSAAGRPSISTAGNVAN